MPEYVLRNLDPQLWSQFTERASHAGWPTRALIVRLMKAYADDEFTPPGPPPRELPQYAWLRAHYRLVAKDPCFHSLDAAAQWARLTEQVLHSPAAMSYRSLNEVPSDRRAQVLNWLRHTSDLPATAALTLRAIAHVGSGPDLKVNRRAFQFEVLGLPAGQQAWIADFNGGWRVLRVIDGAQSSWSEPHLTKDDAKAALAEVVDSTERLTNG